MPRKKPVLQTGQMQIKRVRHARELGLSVDERKYGGKQMLETRCFKFSKRADVPIDCFAESQTALAAK
jgi:hypothetical protein